MDARRGTTIADQERVDSQCTTVLVGGLGGVGQMLLREVEDGLGRVVIYDVKDASGAVDITRPDRRACAELAQADVVILAVPDPVACKAVGLVIKLMKTRALLVETLSVKARFTEELARCTPRGIGVLGINPMFGPSLTMQLRSVAIVDYLPSAMTRWFVELLTLRGAIVERLSTDEHDSAAAVLQAMAHILVLSYAQACVDSQCDLELLARLAPPPGGILLSLATRITNGNHALYSEIQTTREAEIARQKLQEAVSSVCAAAGDEEALTALLAKLAQGLANMPVGMNEMGAKLAAAYGHEQPNGDRGHVAYAT